MPGRCVFCDIIRGELPAVKLYEDQLTIVFLDIYPAAPGHALVVPKQHAERLEHLPRVYREALINTAARVAPLIADALGRDAYNLVLNNGAAAGQEIMHVHMHIIPRGRGDECRVISCRRSRPSYTELRETGERIRRVIEEHLDGLH